MKRFIIFIYGVLSYAVGMGALLYLAGFIGGFLVPKDLNTGVAGSIGEALLINSLLLGLFAIQHSVMARQGFKKQWTRIIPQEAERSTYVMITGVVLAVLFVFWQPLEGQIWHFVSTEAQIIFYSLYALGWLTIVGSSCLINHFDLFGLRQVWLQLRGKEYTNLKFGTPLLYKLVRHPLYLGMLLVLWSTHNMTVTHLFFSIMSTGYILVGIWFEERDLVEFHGEDYLDYQDEVPMIIPGIGAGKNPREKAATAAK